MLLNLDRSAMPALSNGQVHVEPTEMYGLGRSIGTLKSVTQRSGNHR